MAKAGMIVTAILVAVVGIAAFAVHSYAADDPAMPQAGQMAPTFTLPSQDGTQISLDSFKGTWVVLYFYPKDMTTCCTIHKQFCTKENLTFRLLADPDKKVVKAYGSLGNFGVIEIAKRNTFLIDPTGKIVKVWTGVKPDVHSQEVLAELATVEQKGM